MVRLDPFHGLRYQPGRVSGVGAVTAPPYDSIDGDQQARLYAADPRNVVRLEFGREHPGDSDEDNRYTRAAADFARWRGEAVLRPDPAPALYVYEQSFTTPDGPATQVGLLGALGLAPWDDGEVLPHERVFRGPVLDRLRLMRALPVNLSPVFVVYRERLDAVAKAITHARSTTPLCDVRCDDGVRHRLWALTDAATHQRVATAFTNVRVLMADGHHRYTTALEFAAAEGAALPGADAILAYVVAEHDGPIVRPVHRLIRHLAAPPDDALMDAGWSVRPFTDPSRDTMAADAADPHALLATAADALARPGPSAMVWIERGTARVWELTTSDSAVVAALPRPLADLDIARVQATLTGPLGIPDRIEDLVYTADGAAALEQIRRGDADALVLARGVDIDAVFAVAVAGQRMPPKSTSFFPKPRTGFVLRDLS